MTGRGLRVHLALAAVLLGTAAPAAAQLLNLAVSPAVISIPSADPDLVPTVSSGPVTIDYRVRQNSQDTWVLTVLASGDLESGASTIDIAAVSWIATPSPPFQNGTLSRSVAQTVAMGTGNVARPSTGSIIFRLANSWTYDAGTYTQTLVFTLSTP
jgi:hypothetical protein